MQGEPKAGDIIDSRYRLEGEIGRGAHGLVFEAWDNEQGFNVALKILNQEIADDPQYAVRLWREAQSLQALFGTSVVRVFGFGTDAAQGFVYMAMELLHGDTLAAHLRDIEEFGDRMSTFAVLEALDPVARALHTAHSKGIIHRDVKPSNIVLLNADVGGGTRLMDFGLAKLHGAMQLTQVGMVAGSPSYVAPELWRAKPFDHRIDVYSLGAVIFRALAAQPPFMAESVVEILMAATTGARPLLSTFRPELGADADAWVKKALAVEPDDRYPYVSTMWNEFIRIVLNSSGPSAELARQTFSLPS